LGYSTKSHALASINPQFFHKIFRTKPVSEKAIKLLCNNLFRSAHEGRAVGDQFSGRRLAKGAAALLYGESELEDALCKAGANTYRCINDRALADMFSV
jgi:hypothetical protein